MWHISSDKNLSLRNWFVPNIFRTYIWWWHEVNMIIYTLMIAITKTNITFTRAIHNHLCIIYHNLIHYLLWQNHFYFANSIFLHRITLFTNFYRITNDQSIQIYHTSKFVKIWSIKLVHVSFIRVYFSLYIYTCGKYM